MSDSEEDIPDAKECENRCQTFAEVTGTDSALAMFYLQDRQWDLQRSIQDYFLDNGSKEEAPTSNDPEPHRIRLMSWNIDGLDTANLKSRTAGVADVINRERPHVVFLQEVVPFSLAQLEGLCAPYQFFPGGNEGYFTCILLHSEFVQFKDQQLTQFYSSKMGRNLLSIQAKIKGVDCHLMTSHLESTKSSENERKKQLGKAFDEMKKQDNTSFFGGDLNLRDKELAEMGGAPEAILDLWEVTGKRPEAKYTWDTTRNDNLRASYSTRCRFDRLYMKHANTKPALKPVYFELTGIERVASCRRYPSDHWGVLAHLDKV